MGFCNNIRLEFCEQDLLYIYIYLCVQVYTKESCGNLIVVYGCAYTESVSSAEVRETGAADTPSEAKPGKRRRNKKTTPQVVATEEKGKATHRITAASSDHTPNLFIFYTADYTFKIINIVNEIILTILF